MLVAERFLRKELVAIYEQDAEQVTFFRYVADRLMALGYVEDSYLEAIIEREKKYPTGLNTPTLEVAIPHTDPQHIKQPFIYIIKLKTPVIFGEMGTDDVFVKARYAFCLGFTKGADQLVLLQDMMTMFMDKLVMESLEAETSKEKIFDLMINYFNKE